MAQLPGYAALLMELLDDRPRESFLGSGRAALGFLSVPFSRPPLVPGIVPGT